jgi:REP element-mobilizing transposase RayT
MSYNSKVHHRRSIRLKGYDYSQAGLYFVTICCQNKICRFGKIINGKMILNNAGKIASQCWLAIPQHFPDVVLHNFVVMPNHVHGIVEIIKKMPENNVGANNYSPLPQPHKPHGTSRTIGSMVRGFKIGMAKQLGYSTWQRNYYEHIIRNGKSYERIANYIINNPVKWWNDRFYFE